MTIMIGITAGVMIGTTAMITAIVIVIIGTGIPMIAATMTAGETTIAEASALPLSLGTSPVSV